MPPDEQPRSAPRAGWHFARISKHTARTGRCDPGLFERSRSKPSCAGPGRNAALSSPRWVSTPIASTIMSARSTGRRRPSRCLRLPDSSRVRKRPGWRWPARGCCSTRGPAVHRPATSNSYYMKSRSASHGRRADGGCERLIQPPSVGESFGLRDFAAAWRACLSARAVSLAVRVRMTIRRLLIR